MNKVSLEVAKGSKAERMEFLRLQVCECVRCGLATTRTQTVFGEGSFDARVLFVGEAPGADEDKEGRAFVGASGRLLNNILAALRWRREDVYVCNVLRCRPPRNRVPTPNEIENCSSFLERQIEVVNPEFIVCLGSVASTAVVGLPVGQARGKWFAYKNRRVLCTYHPGYLLRNQHAKKEVWQDLQLLIGAMNADVGVSSSGNGDEAVGQAELHGN